MSRVNNSEGICFYVDRRTSHYIVGMGGERRAARSRRVHHVSVTAGSLEWDRRHPGWRDLDSVLDHEHFHPGRHPCGTRTFRAWLANRAESRLCILHSGVGWPLSPTTRQLAPTGSGMSSGQRCRACRHARRQRPGVLGVSAVKPRWMEHLPRRVLRSGSREYGLGHGCDSLSSAGRVYGCPSDLLAAGRSARIPASTDRGARRDERCGATGSVSVRMDWLRLRPLEIREQRLAGSASRLRRLTERCSRRAADARRERNLSVSPAPLAAERQDVRRTKEFQCVIRSNAYLSKRHDWRATSSHRD